MGCVPSCQPAAALRPEPVQAQSPLPPPTPLQLPQPMTQPVRAGPLVADESGAVRFSVRAERPARAVEIGLTNERGAWVVSSDGHFFGPGRVMRRGMPVPRLETGDVVSLTSVCGRPGHAGVLTLAVNDRVLGVFNRPGIPAGAPLVGECVMYDA